MKNFINLNEVGVLLADEITKIREDQDLLRGNFLSSVHRRLKEIAETYEMDDAIELIYNRTYVDLQYQDGDDRTRSIGRLRVNEPWSYNDEEMKVEWSANGHSEYSCNQPDIYFEGLAALNRIRKIAVANKQSFDDIWIWYRNTNNDLHNKRRKLESELNELRFMAKSRNQELLMDLLRSEDGIDLRQYIDGTSLNWNVYRTSKHDVDMAIIKVSKETKKKLVVLYEYQFRGYSDREITLASPREDNFNKEQFLDDLHYFLQRRLFDQVDK